MALWILSARDDLPKDTQQNPWYPPTSDCVYTCVVRAETEEQARKLAAQNGGEEFIHGAKLGDSPWLHDQYTTCVVLTGEGEPAVLCQERI